MPKDTHSAERTDEALIFGVPDDGPPFEAVGWTYKVRAVCLNKGRTFRDRRTFLASELDALASITCTICRREHRIVRRHEAEERDLLSVSPGDHPAITHELVVLLDDAGAL